MAHIAAKAVVLVQLHAARLERGSNVQHALQALAHCAVEQQQLGTASDAARVIKLLPESITRTSAAQATLARQRSRVAAAFRVMTVTLSVDHRVVDGALGANWLKTFKGILEDPLSLML